MGSVALFLIGRGWGRRWSYAAALSLAATCAAQTERYTGPIIDVHLHTSNADSLKQIRRGLSRSSAATPPLPSDRGAAAQDARVASALGIVRLADLPELDAEEHMNATLREMNRFNIRRGMLSGNYQRALAWAQTAPGRFLLGDAPLRLDVLKDARATGRLDCLGEWGPQYRGLGPTDPILEPFWAWAEAEDLPVAYHMHPGPPGAPLIGLKIKPGDGRPLLLDEVLRRHPKLRLYVMHAGWPFIDEMIAMMWAFPQLHVDVAVINWSLARSDFHSYLKRFVDLGFVDRVMFGSDQMEWPEVIAHAVDAVNSAAFLTLAQKRAIFHDNAVRFFRLDEEKSR